ncbi:MAG: hypothetical protein PHS96_01800 [Anaerolineales bacterium]|nr:hypothetical protein [Anaerolineales bacterium]MDD5466517.1 hypothetical protein [Anaerolineales bacterium]
MLDDLRNQASSATYIEDKELPHPEGRLPYRERRILGMTALQRFAIVTMLFVIACLLSTFCLLVTEKVMLPFI